MCSRLALVISLGAGLALAACASPAPPLYDVSVAPADITPNQDGVSDVARLSYAVGAPSRITVTLASDAGTHVLRGDQLRTPDRYETLFGGVIDGRMIPDGDYVVRFEAHPLDPSLAPVVEERQLMVRDADASPPGVESFAVQPQVLTPNQDGIGDVVTVSYRLDTPAEVRVFLEDAEGTFVSDILEDEDSATHAGEPGAHQYRYDAGVEADAQPPPDGQYRVVIEARDAAGNLARETHDLELREGGQPRASLYGDVEWSATTVPLGDTLAFTVTVRNVGNAPIRTRGPEPGFEYDSTSSFNQAPPPGLILHVVYPETDEQTAVWVAAGESDVVVDLNAPAEALAERLSDATAAGSGASATTDGIGATGAAGEAAPTTEESPSKVTVCGTVISSGAPAHGAVVTALEPDGDGIAQLETDARGAFCFEDLRLPPAHERTFARSPGAIRVGLDHDESRRDVEYPYRWQLGRTSALAVCDSAGRLYLCLLPGRETTVTGSVRITEAPYRRLANAFLGLMHEDVRQMHGPYDPEAITFEY